MKKEMCRFAEDMCLQTHCIHQRVGNLSLRFQLELKASLSNELTILFVNITYPLVRAVSLVRYEPTCFMRFIDYGWKCRVDQV